MLRFKVSVLLHLKTNSSKRNRWLCALAKKMQYKNPKKMQCNTPVQERQVDVTAHFKKHSLNLVILLWALCAVFFRCTSYNMVHIYAYFEKFSIHASN